MKIRYTVIILLLITLGTVFQCLTMFRSGAMYDFGIGYWGPTARDGIWHQALVGQLIKNIPPENPGFAGSKLTNYHYFYDLLVALTSKITFVSPTDLIFRICPVIFSLLFGLGTYFLSNLMFKDKLTNLLVLYFAYFGSSFGWIVEFIREGRLGGESAFWMNQPVSMNLNPPFAISMVLMIVVLILLVRYKGHKNWKQSLLMIAIISTLSGFKIYAGIIVLLSLGIICFYELVVLRKNDLLVIFIPSLLLTFILFFLQNGNLNGLMIKPFWFINSMIDSPDRVGWIKLSNAREAYFAYGNWIKYFLVQVLSLAIYLVGNFGTRIIGVLSLIFISKKVLWERKYYLLLTILVVSLIIPVLFIQKGNPWNSIQFSYYCLYTLSLFTGFALSKLARKLPFVIACCVVFAVLVVTPVSSYTTFTFAYTNNPPAKLTVGEYAALSYLKTLEPGVVLTPAFDKSLRSRYVNPYPLAVYDATSYVSAYSGMTVYIEDEEQQKILGVEYLSRVNKTNKFFTAIDTIWSREFLEQNNIKYIYIPKLYNYSVDVYGSLLEKLFKNDEATIFTVKL